MEQDKAAIEEIVKSVERAWNAGDSKGFAAPFAEDADYVIINGMHAKGRAAIDEGHRRIFDTIYKGSNNTMTVESVRFIRPDVALVHARAHLKFHDGKNVREGKGRSTWVMTQDDGKWSIAAFQNTPIVPPGD